MKILALEPYFGGSHKAFLNGWSGHSRHDWTTLTLPPYKWKWRMRHAAITLADEARQRADRGERWDLILCSDMLNLGEFLGLTPKSVCDLPRMAYFHENQLTYPVRVGHERDYHFVITNMVTALAADAVWFNSDFHRQSFLGELPAFLKKMPDHQPYDVIDRIMDKSAIQPQGVKECPERGPRKPGPLHILWAARWEHDKNPDDFFLALKTLKNEGVEFRLNVIGEQFREKPPIFDWARQYFFHHIDRWGYQDSREEYDTALAEADVFVSTANHEFFGITAVEAMVAGAYPVLPQRLAYPEVISSTDEADTDRFFYAGTAEALAERLTDLANRLKNDDLWQGNPNRARQLVQRYTWKNLAPVLDTGLDEIAKQEA